MKYDPDSLRYAGTGGHEDAFRFDRVAEYCRWSIVFKIAVMDLFGPGSATRAGEGVNYE